VNIIEHLLTVLGEEGGELAKEASKANRFGLGDRNVLHPEGPDNRERLEAELNDLIATARLLEVLGVLRPTKWNDPRAQAAKWDKLGKFLQYAIKTGALHHAAGCGWHLHLDLCNCGLQRALDLTGYEGPVPEPAPHKEAK
jgi:hypothetical protein